MAPPNRMEELLREHGEEGETEEQFLLRYLNRYGTMTRVAGVLDTTLETILRHCQRYGIEKRITWIKHNTEPVLEAETATNGD